jgi:hypothetical protein
MKMSAWSISNGGNEGNVVRHVTKTRMTATHIGRMRRARASSEAAAARYTAPVATIAKTDDGPKNGVGTDRNPSGPWVKTMSSPKWRPLGPTRWSAARHDSSMPIGAASVNGHARTTIAAEISSVGSQPLRSVAPLQRRPAAVRA